MNTLTFCCKKCKKEFPLEQHPSPAYKKYLKESDNDDSRDASTAEQIVVKLKKVMESISCPDPACKGGVYLTGIGDVLVGEFDLTSEPIVQSIHSAVRELRSGNYDEYKEYEQEIIRMLLDNPGKLIYIEDPELKKEAIKAVRIIWANVEWEDLYNKMIEPGEGAFDIAADYVERAKRLYPTFVSLRLDNITTVYFQNAMASWLFGLNESAVILCWSVIEFILKEKYPKYQFKSDRFNINDMRINKRDMKEIIDAITKDRHIDDNISNKMHRVRKSRNGILHDRRPISNDDAFSMIQDTKEIIEIVLSE